jgi:hypothetical protein
MTWLGHIMNSRPAKNAAKRSIVTPKRASAYMQTPVSVKPSHTAPLYAATALFDETDDDREDDRDEGQYQNGSASNPETGPTPSTSVEMPCG